MELYFTRLHWNTHTFPVAATADGLCYVGAWDEPEELFDDWSRKHFPEPIGLLLTPRLLHIRSNCWPT